MKHAAAGVKPGPGCPHLRRVVSPLDAPAHALPVSRWRGGASARPPRVALYSHDTMGLGHVGRSIEKKGFADLVEAEFAIPLNAAAPRALFGRAEPVGAPPSAVHTARGAR